MKRFYYVCDFMAKNPEDPKKAACLERHIFVFVVRENKDHDINRLCDWWDPSFEDDDSEEEI